MKASERRLQYSKFTIMDFSPSLEKIIKEKTPDPTTFSPIMERSTLENTGRTITYEHGKKIDGKIIKQLSTVSIFQDSNTEEYYIEKHEDKGADEQNLKLEHFISLLTKGILRSSDMVEVNGKYFSRIIDLEETKVPKSGELESELFLLNYLFFDRDKSIPDFNMHTDTSGRFAHYDYGRAFIKQNNIPAEIRLISIGKYRERRGLVRNIKTGLDLIGVGIRGENISAKKELLIKTKQVLEALDNDSFFSAIIVKSKFNTEDKRFTSLAKNTKEGRIEELRNILKKKCQNLVKILEEKNL